MPLNFGNRFWLRFDVWLCGVTLLYIVLAVAWGYIWTLDGPGHPGNPFINLLGLFAPVGPNNFIVYVLSPLGWAAGLLVISVGVLGEGALKRFTGVSKILLNIIVLLALTFAVDLIMFKNWESETVLAHSLGMRSIGELFQPVPSNDYLIDPNAKQLAFISCSADLYTQNRSSYDVLTRIYSARHPGVQAHAGAACKLADGTSLVSYTYISSSDMTEGQAVARIDRESHITQELQMHQKVTGNSVAPTFESITDNVVRFKVSSGATGDHAEKVYDLDLTDFSYKEVFDQSS